MRLGAHVLLVAALLAPFASAHYYGYCITPGPSVPNTLRDSDPMTIYINSNHNSFTGGCFYNYANQARVDILDTNGNVISVEMVQGVTHQPKDVYGNPVDGTFSYRDPTDQWGRVGYAWSQGWGTKPAGDNDHCPDATHYYWFKIGPFYIPQDANLDSEVLKLKIWGIGCQGDMTSALLDFQPMDTTPCPAGQLRDEVSLACANCAAGRLGASTGLYSSSNPDCTTSCPKGHYCPLGTRYFDSTSDSGAYTTQQGPQKCSAGNWGGESESTATCQGACDPGYYCVAGSSSSKGFSVSVTSNQGVSETASETKCAAGRMGGEGQSASTCSSACTAGSYCVAGTGITTACDGTTSAPSWCPQKCGTVSRYCPEGSSSSLPASTGYYTTPENDPAEERKAQSQCQPGTYCAGGVASKCAAGLYGDAAGLSLPACSGSCTAGFVCAEGSSSPSAEACAEGQTQPANYFCRAGSSSRTTVQSNYYSIPENSPAEQREGELECPTDSTCTNGIRRLKIQFVTSASDYSACNPNLNVDENLVGAATSPQEVVIATKACLETDGAGDCTSYYEPSRVVEYTFETGWDYTSNLVHFFGFDNSLDNSADTASPLTASGFSYSTTRKYGSNSMSLSPTSSVTFNAGTSCTLQRGSVAMWVQPESWESGDTFYPFSMATTGYDEQMRLIYLGSGTTQFYMARQGSIVVNLIADTSTVYNNGEWVHIAVTWDTESGNQGAVRLYFDGSLHSEVTLGSSKSFAINAITTGYWGRPDDSSDSNYRMPGLLDDGAVFDVALKSSEIAHLASQGGRVRQTTCVNSNPFLVDSSTGALTVGTTAVTVDCSRYTVTIKATIDGSTPEASAWCTSTLSVVDVNDPPVFDCDDCSAHSSLTVAEKSEKNTRVGDPIPASDPDSEQTVLYSIDRTRKDGSYGATPSSAGMFHINRCSGQITVLQDATTGNVLDYVVKGTHELWILIEDDYEGTLGPCLGPCSVAKLVTVTVTNINDAPVISPDTVFSVDENAPGATLSPSTATFSDPDPDDLHTWEIFRNDDDCFEIDATTGTLTTKSTCNLNHEVKPSYNIELKVSDNGSQTGGVGAEDKFDKQDFYITVNDINDAPTVTATTLNIDENSNNDVELSGTNPVAVSDEDNDPVQTLTYAIGSAEYCGSQRCDAVFELTAANKWRVRDNSVLNYEAPLTSCTCSLVVTDNGSPSTSGTGVVTININDVNERPIITSPTGLSVAEDMTVGHVVGTVTATDPDAGQEKIFTLETSTNDWFRVNTDGTIVVNSALDFEAYDPATFSMTVKVMDNGYPAMSMTTAAFTIAVTNVNEAPEVTPGQQFDIDENSASVALLVLADDQDAGDLAALTYELDPASSIFKFETSSSNRLVLQDGIDVNERLNFEDTPSITVYAKVTDDESLSSSAVGILISLNNKNDQPALATATRYVKEDAGQGYSVGGVLVATDDDLNCASNPCNSANWGVLSYAITGGNDGDAFEIVTAVGTNTGQISCKQDAEIRNVVTDQRDWYLTIVVSDASGGSDSLSSTAVTVHVQLTEVNDPPVPVCTAMDLNENTLPSDTAIGTITAIDPDDGDTATISYAFQSGNDLDAFEIVGTGASAQIRVKTDVIDFENKPTYTLVVAASDTKTPALTGTCTITMTVNDVNEMPQIYDSTRNIAENSGVDTAVGVAIGASDPDSTAGDTLFFRIVDGNINDVFQIDESSGIISVAQDELNFETMPAYTLTVAVRDRADAGAADVLEQTATITVGLLDMNEAPTMDTVLMRSVSENAGTGTLVGQALAFEDPDNGQTHRFTVSGCGEIDYPYAYHSYSSIYGGNTVGEGNGRGGLNDGAGTGWRANVDDTNQWVVLDTGYHTLDSNVRIGGIATKARSGSDASQRVLSYTVEFSTDNGASFTPVDSGTTFTGQSTSDGAEFTKTNHFTSPVQASHIRIKVVDWNEHVAMRVGLLYCFPDAPFSVDDSGQLFVAPAAGLNHEAYNEYIVDVTVADSDSPPLSATTRVVVAVDDVNEDPYFGQSSYAFTIPENSFEGTVVSTAITATDDDDSSLAIGQYKFSLAAGEINFYIDENTGQLEVPCGAASVLYTNAAIGATVTVDTPCACMRSCLALAGCKAWHMDMSGSKECYRKSSGTSPVESSGYIGGTVDLSSKFNFEQTSEYAVTVTVTDSGSPAKVASVVATVTVEAVNEPPTAFYVNGEYHVNENSDPDTAIGSALAATDPDAGAQYSFRIYDEDWTTIAYEAPGTGLNDGTDYDSLRTLDFGNLPTYVSNKEGYYVRMEWEDKNIEFFVPAGSDIFEQVEAKSITIEQVQESGDFLQLGTSSSGVFCHACVNGGTRYGQTCWAILPSAGDSACGCNDADQSGRGIFYGGLEKCSTCTCSSGGFAGDKVPTTPQSGLVSVGLTIKIKPQPSWSNAPKFTIGMSNGILKVAGDLNYEDPSGNTYTFKVVVSDPTYPQLIDGGIITVMVDDVNEAPVYPNYARSVEENSALNTAVGENCPEGPGCGCIATDVDRTASGEEQILIYTILSYTQKLKTSSSDAGTWVPGDSQPVFAINPCTGIITVKRFVLDFEAVPEYLLQVSVTDDGGEENNPLSDDAEITVTIVDINEAPTLSDATRRADENSVVGTTVGAVLTGQDQDGYGTDTFTFNITGGEGFGIFEIDADSGQVTVAVASLDYETRGLWTVVVTVTDGGTGGVADSQLSSSATLTININDVNEKPTLPADTTRSVNENPSDENGDQTTIGERANLGSPLIGGDVDAGQVLSYSIQQVWPLTDIFAIDSATGQLSIDRTTLDFETIEKYTLAITVTDDGLILSDASASSTLSSVTNMTVTVADVNERPWLVDNSSLTVDGVNFHYFFQMDETAASGSTVGHLEGDDYDGDQLQFELIDGNSAGHFVVTNAGLLRYLPCCGSVNFEADDIYDLVVQVTDGTLTNTGNVRIEIVDDNEPPVISDASRSIDENSNINTAVYYTGIDGEHVGSPIVATDVDNADAGMLVYTIEGGDGDEDKFNIGASSGQVTVAPGTHLDYEVKNQYELVIVVTDSGWRLPVYRRNATLTINIGQVQEAPTFENSTLRVGEYSSYDTAVGVPLTSITEDSDSDFSELTYSILDSSWANARQLFRIVASTGQIEVDVDCVICQTDSSDAGCTAICAEYTASKIHLLHVRVTYGHSNDAMAVINITVTDQNFPPTLGFHDFNVSENSEIGAVVGTVQGSDEVNVGVEVDLDYEFVSGNPGIGLDIFEVNQVTGVITVKGEIDFEAFATYNLSVSVTDPGGLSATNIARIDINDINEVPAISNPAVLRVVAENSPAATLVGVAIVATDQDVADTVSEGTLTLAVSGTESTNFAIDIYGQITVAAGAVLDYETKTSYTFQVTVSDSADNNIEYDVTIGITNVNEQVTADPLAQRFNLDENANAEIFGAFRAVDPDLPSQTDTDGCKDDCELKYEITKCLPSLTCNGIVSIDAVTGELSSIRQVDFEESGEFSYLVNITDNWQSVQNNIQRSGVQTKTAAWITVNIVDQNDTTVTSIMRDGEVDPATAHDFPTTGSSQARFVGTNFGPKVGRADNPVATVTATYSMGAGYPTYEAGCSVDVQNTEVLCAVVAGVGIGFHWTFTINTAFDEAQDASSWLQTDLTTSYNPPSIESVSTGGSGMPTSGNTALTITGSNFGPQSTNSTRTDVSVKYGPPSDPEAFTAASCAVSIDHSAVECETAPGVGKDMVFKIGVGPGKFLRNSWTYPTAAKQYSTSYATSGASAVSYDPPTLTTVSAVERANMTTISTMATSGSDYIVVVGDNFGPLCGSSVDPECIGTQIRYFVGAHDYTASGCEVVTAHTKLRCPVVAGVGAGLETELMVGLQTTAAFSSTLLSYTAPTIASAALDGAAVANTEGGQKIIITGNNFGPQEKAPSVEYGKFAESIMTAASCVVSRAHVEITCSAVEGTGKHHPVVVYVGEQASPESTDQISYHHPVLTQIEPTYEVLEGADTEGFEGIKLVGRQFGPIEDSSFERLNAVTYGVELQDEETSTCNCPRDTPCQLLTSFSTCSDLTYNTDAGGYSCDTTTERDCSPDFEFHAAKCNVTKAHEEITCWTSAGAGKEHQWLLLIDGQYSSSPTTSYHKPEITSITAAGDVHQLQMAGGDTVTLTGTNFGPPAGSVKFGTAYLESVTYGPSGVEYTATCELKSHTEAECVTAAGYGSDSKWYVTVAGQKNELMEGVTTSYASPVISSMEPANAPTGGGTRIDVIGSNFGLPTWAKVVFNGEIFDVFDHSSDVGGDSLSFSVPEGPFSGGGHSNQLSVIVGLHEYAFADCSGNCQQSVEWTFTYDDPVITKVVLKEGPQGQYDELEMYIYGVNFGPADIGSVYVGDTIVDTVVRTCTNWETETETCTSWTNAATIPDDQITDAAATAAGYYYGHVEIKCLYSPENMDTPAGYTQVVIDSGAQGVKRSNAYRFENFNPLIIESQSTSHFYTDAQCAEIGFCTYYSYSFPEDCVDRMMALTTAEYTEGTATEYCKFDKVAEGIAVPTIGGGNLTVSGRFFGSNPQVFISIPGKACLVESDCESGICLGSGICGVACNRISIVRDENEDVGQFTTVVCTVPEGVGSGIEMVVRSVATDLESLFRPFHYKAPVVTWDNDGVLHTPTTGGSVMIIGHDFGTSQAKVWIGDLEGGLKWEAVVTQQNHTHATFSVPAGEGASHAISLDVAGQYSNLATFNYDKPVVTRVTQNSSSSLVFHGENLGDHSLSAYGGTTPQIIVIRHNGTELPDDCASFASAHDHVRVTTDLCQDIGELPGASLMLIISGQNVTFLGPMIDSIEIVAGTSMEEEINANMPRTEGGATLKISGVYFTDPNISVTVGGNDCPVTRFDRAGSSVNAAVAPEQNMSTSTVWCTVPAGQGANQMVEVAAGVMRSMPIGLSYLGPVIDWDMTTREGGIDVSAEETGAITASTWDTPSTQGETIVIKGDNFGTQADALISGAALESYNCLQIADIFHNDTGPWFRTNYTGQSYDEQDVTDFKGMSITDQWAFVRERALLEQFYLDSEGPVYDWASQTCKVEVLDHQTARITLPAGQGAGHTLALSVSGQVSENKGFAYHEPITFPWEALSCEADCLPSLAGLNASLEKPFCSELYERSIQGGHLAKDGGNTFELDPATGWYWVEPNGDSVSHSMHEDCFPPRATTNGTALKWMSTQTKMGRPRAEEDTPGTAEEYHTDFEWKNEEYITLNGRNFGHPRCDGPGCGSPGSTPELTVMFGQFECTWVTWTQTQIQCIPSAGQGKALTVGVTTAGQKDESLAFSYSPPIIVGVTPITAGVNNFTGHTTAGCSRTQIVGEVTPAGCTFMTMTGENFGTQGVVVLGEKTTPPYISVHCGIVEHTHDRVVFEVPSDYGFGGGRSLILVQGGNSVDDKNGHVMHHSEKFKYNAPSIHPLGNKKESVFLEGVNPDMPTTGRDSYGNDVVLTITGDSFGESFEYDEGNGKMTTEYSAVVRIFTNKPEDCSATSSSVCKSYLRQPCDAELRITTNCFDNTFKNGVFDNEAGATCDFETASREKLCMDCTVIHQQHDMILCNPGPGFGGPLDVVVELRPNMNRLPEGQPSGDCADIQNVVEATSCESGEEGVMKHAECALAKEFTGDNTICQMSPIGNNTIKDREGTISYRAPILTEFFPSRFTDATGKDGRDQPITLTVKGENFGNILSEAFVFFDGQECTDAKWNDPYEVVDGQYVPKVAGIEDPFITCTSPNEDTSGAQRVGWKKIELTVALQTVEYLPDCVQEIEIYNRTSEMWIKVNSTACGSKLRAECKEGFFGADGEFCQECSPGMICDLANIATPDSRAGYWEFSVNPNDPDFATKCIATNDADSAAFQESRINSLCTGQEENGVWNPDACNKGEGCPYYSPCEPQEACIGENVCAEEYSGPRCSLCAKDYFKLSGVCTPCPSCQVCLLLFLFLALVLGSTAMWFLVKAKVNIGVLSIGVDYFQILSILAMSNKVHWPATMKTILQYLSVFSFNLDLAAPECMVDPELFKYEYKWFFIEGMPVIACLCFLLFHYYVYFKKKCLHGRTKHLHNHAHLGMGNGLITFYLLYLYITKTSLDIFNCSPTTPAEIDSDGNEIKYLEVVFVECFEKGGIHLTLFPWAIITFVSYSLGFPALVAFIVFKNRKRCIDDQILRAEQSVRRPAEEQRKQELKDARVWNFRKRFSTLYYQYKPEFFYWKLIILARKFCVATAGLLFRRYPVFLLAFSLLILFASYALQVRNQPYMSNVEMQDVAERNKEKLGQIRAFEDKSTKTVRGATKKLGKKFKLDKSEHLDDHNKSKARGALEFLWNYNTVEATLLCCAVLILLFGLMFQDRESVAEGSKEETGLFIITLSVMLFSILYFATVAFSEIYIGLGHSCSCVKRCMQHNDRFGRKNSSRSSEQDDIDKNLQDNVNNPMANRRDDQATNPMHAKVAEQQEFQEETIKAQQEEIARLKKENQAKMLSSFGSSKKGIKKKGGAKKQKKTFSAPSSEEIVMKHETDTADEPNEEML